MLLGSENIGCLRNDLQLFMFYRLIIYVLSTLVKPIFFETVTVWKALEVLRTKLGKCGLFSPTCTGCWQVSSVNPSQFSAECTTSSPVWLVYEEECKAILYYRRMVQRISMSNFDSNLGRMVIPAPAYQVLLPDLLLLVLQCVSLDEFWDAET